MVLVMLYAVVNILFSAFAGKRRWKLQAVVHGFMLVSLLALLAVYAMSESAADLVTILTGNRANAIREALDMLGGAFTLAPVLVIEAALLVQAVFSGLLVAIVAVSYIQAKLTRKATFADRAVIHKTFRRAEKREIFTPIRSLWQMNCVMNC